MMSRAVIRILDPMKVFADTSELAIFQLACSPTTTLNKILKRTKYDSLKIVSQDLRRFSRFREI